MPQNINKMGRDMPFDEEETKIHPPFTSDGVCSHFSPICGKKSFSNRNSGWIESSQFTVGFCSCEGECGEKGKCASVPEGSDMRTIVDRLTSVQVLHFQTIIRNAMIRTLYLRQPKTLF